MDEGIWVLKENGERELFNPEKVLNALRRAGLGVKQSDQILKDLRPKLRNGITTKRIYSLTYGMVEELKPELSHRYNLKRALFEMGPEGYAFEDFVARLLALEGYDTKLRQILQGKCVSHEIDVVASKGKNAYMVECKFHNQPGLKCRIQTVLYVYARYLDLTGKKIDGEMTKPWLITNTKFSEDVVQYAECMRIPLLGWRYPFGKGLEATIDAKKCYPVSVLDIGHDTIKRLIAKRVTTVFDIPDNATRLADETGLTLAKAREVVEKAEYAK